MSDGLSARDVASIIGVPESRVRYWAQIGLVGPSYRPADGSRAMYAFTDLVAAKAARELTERGVPARRVREAIHALRAQLPALDRPLLHLRVLSDGERLVIAGDQPFEPLTGQRVMDFALDELSAEVAALEERAVPRPISSIEHTRREASGPTPTSALAWFDAALHETTVHNHDAAIAAYRRALALDAHLGPAHANLGALLASRGDKAEAATHLDRALALDPGSVQARMASAMLHEAEGAVERALSLWAELCADRSSPAARAGITRNAALSDARATRRGS